VLNYLSTGTTLPFIRKKEMHEKPREFCNASGNNVQSLRPHIFKIVSDVLIGCSIRRWNLYLNKAICNTN
jgi:hypothetical protein